MIDTFSFLFLLAVNFGTGLICDDVFKNVYSIKIFNFYPSVILSITSLYLLTYLDVEGLYLLNVFFCTLISAFFYFILAAVKLEKFLINIKAHTITELFFNNFKFAFQKYCEDGNVDEVNSFLIINGIMIYTTNTSILCNHSIKDAVIKSALNNHVDVLRMILDYFVNAVNNEEFLKPLLFHVSSLGYYDIFRLLVNRTDIKLLDTDFYNIHSLKIKIDDAMGCISEDYQKAVSILEMKSAECDILDENCMICHETHSNIIKLNCNHYVCLDALCKFYHQHLNLEMTCFICRKNIILKECTSISKI